VSSCQEEKPPTRCAPGQERKFPQGTRRGWRRLRSQHAYARVPSMTLDGGRDADLGDSVNVALEGVVRVVLEDGDFDNGLALCGAPDAA
jgi:hypothetical protein